MSRYFTEIIALIVLLNKFFVKTPSIAQFYLLVTLLNFHAMLDKISAGGFNYGHYMKGLTAADNLYSKVTNCAVP